LKRLARIMCSNGLEGPGGEEECCLTQSFGCSLLANLALRHIGLPTVLFQGNSNGWTLPALPVWGSARRSCQHGQDSFTLLQPNKKNWYRSSWC
jgi:hypothetical protein